MLLQVFIHIVSLGVCFAFLYVPARKIKDHVSLTCLLQEFHMFSKYSQVVALLWDLEVDMPGEFRSLGTVEAMITLDYLGWLKLITCILKTGEAFLAGSESWDRRGRWCDSKREKDLSHHCWLWRWRKMPWAKKGRLPLAGKGKRIIPCQLPVWNPAMPTPVF